MNTKVCELSDWSFWKDVMRHYLDTLEEPLNETLTFWRSSNNLTLQIDQRAIFPKLFRKIMCSFENCNDLRSSESDETYLLDETQIHWNKQLAIWTIGKMIFLWTLRISNSLQYTNFWTGKILFRNKISIKIPRHWKNTKLIFQFIRGRNFPFLFLLIHQQQWTSPFTLLLSKQGSINGIFRLDWKRFIV